MDADASLWTLFASSFLAATLLPGGSEAVLFAVLRMHPDSAWSAVAWATVGNTLGGMSFWKPHPLPFQNIMKEFGGDPSQYVYIADNPIKDFIAPKSLGWQTIQIERPLNIYFGTEVPAEHRAHRTVSSLRELENL